MGLPGRSVRFQINENDFPLKNNNFPDDFLLEVVNQIGEVSALFCLINSSHLDHEFQNLKSFAQYFDDINIGLCSSYNWQLHKDVIEAYMKRTGVSSIRDIQDEIDLTPDDPIEEFSKYDNLWVPLVCYGRLRYPYMLGDTDKKGYESELIFELEDFLTCYHYEYKFNYCDCPEGLNQFKDYFFEFSADFGDIFNFYIDLLRKSLSDEEILNQKKEAFELFNDFGLDIYTEVGENFLTKENIDLFIELMEEKQKKDLLNFLLEFRNSLPNKNNDN